MKQRNTVQRALVYEAVNRLKSHATADEIYHDIAAQHPSVSRSTVYRNLNLLAESGEIRKFETPGGPDRYDHRCFNHYHARCLSCGRLFDIEMDYMPDLPRKILDAHGFAVSGHDILFNGLCPACQQAERG